MNPIWEYEITDFFSVAAFNEMGMQGWELVGFAFVSSGGKQVWKRKALPPFVAPQERP